MKKTLYRVLPFVLVFPLLLTFVVGVSASESLVILDPMDLAASVYPTDDGYLMSLTPDPNLTCWERYYNGTLNKTVVGVGTMGNTLREGYLNRISYNIYPFGQNAVMPLAGLSADASWDSTIELTFEDRDAMTQSVDVTLCQYLVHVDSDGNVLHLFPGEPYTWTYDATSYSRGVYTEHTSFEVFRSSSFDVFSGDGGYFYVYYTCDLSGIADTSVTDYVVFYLSSSCNLTVPVSSTYGSFLQFGQTNAYLDRIHTVLQENGQTLQDILGEQYTTNDRLHQIINGQIDPIIPSGGDSVSDALDQEHQITQDAFIGFQEFDGVQLTAIDVLSQYRLVLLAVSHFLSELINLPFFYSLIYLGLSLGVLAVVLNITFSVGDSLSHKDTKSK